MRGEDTDLRNKEFSYGPGATTTLMNRDTTRLITTGMLRLTQQLGFSSSKGTKDIMRNVSQLHSQPARRKLHDGVDPKVR